MCLVQSRSSIVTLVLSVIIRWCSTWPTSSFLMDISLSLPWLIIRHLGRLVIIKVDLREYFRSSNSLHLWLIMCTVHTPIGILLSLLGFRPRRVWLWLGRWLTTRYLACSTAFCQVLTYHRVVLATVLTCQLHYLVGRRDTILGSFNILGCRWSFLNSFNNNTRLHFCIIIFLHCLLVNVSLDSTEWILIADIDTRLLLSPTHIHHYLRFVSFHT